MTQPIEATLKDSFNIGREVFKQCYSAKILLEIFQKLDNTVSFQVIEESKELVGSVSLINYAKSIYWNLVMIICRTSEQSSRGNTVYSLHELADSLLRSNLDYDTTTAIPSKYNLPILTISHDEKIEKAGFSSESILNAIKAALYDKDETGPNNAIFDRIRNIRDKRVGHYEIIENFKVKELKIHDIPSAIDQLYDCINFIDKYYFKMKLQNELISELENSEKELQHDLDLVLKQLGFE